METVFYSSNTFKHKENLQNTRATKEPGASKQVLGGKVLHKKGGLK